MKIDTIHKHISKWSDFIGVKRPRLEFENVFRASGLKGRYDPRTKTIYIYGYNRSTIKHEFIHYLQDVIGREMNNNLFEGYETYINSHIEIEARKKVCMSWKNIKKWFYHDYKELSGKK